MKETDKKKALYAALTIVGLVIFNAVKALVKPADLENYYIIVLTSLTVAFIAILGLFLSGERAKYGKKK